MRRVEGEHFTGLRCLGAEQAAEGIVAVAGRAVAAVVDAQQLSGQIVLVATGDTLALAGLAGAVSGQRTGGLLQRTLSETWLL